MLKTAICDLLGIEYPIIQGGMAHLGTAELVSAVSNAGGLGIVGAGHYTPDWVRDQIRHTKERTSNPFGINIPLMSPYVEQVIHVILEEKVAVSLALLVQTVNVIAVAVLVLHFSTFKS